MRRLLPIILSALAASALAQTARLEPVSPTKVADVGRLRPRSVQLSATRPDSITKAPTTLRAPQYAILPVGPRPESGEPKSQTFHVILDTPAGGPTLLVDANGNGDLTDDPPIKWEKKPYQGVAGELLTGHEGVANLEFKSDADTFAAPFLLSRPDPSDAARADAKSGLSYVADYVRLGQLTLTTGSFKIVLADDQSSGDFRPVPPPAAPNSNTPKPSGIRLLIDLNGDDKFDPKKEIFDPARPFNIEGVRYEIQNLSPLGDEFTVARAGAPAPVARLAKTFQASTLDRKTINFPSTYKGRLVLLDFWATWCGPCMNEVPGVVSAYKTYHAKGLDVLGISLDGPGARDHVLEITSQQDMTWPQVYDGKQWQARIAVLYGIHSIPSAFLVDGDTGEIVASGGALRGARLSQTLDKALAAKKAKSK